MQVIDATEPFRIVAPTGATTLHSMGEHGRSEVPFRDYELPE